MKFPNFLSTPAFVVGMPVVRANFCRTCVMPSALFHENDSPGIPVFDFLRVIVFLQLISQSIFSTNIPLPALVVFGMIVGNGSALLLVHPSAHWKPTGMLVFPVCNALCKNLSIEDFFAAGQSRQTFFAATKVLLTTTLLLQL